MHNCELNDDIFLTQFTRHEKHLLLSALPSLRGSEITSGPNPQKDMITWLQEHAVRLCARPSAQPVLTTPAKTRMVNLHSFYKGK
jgi:hypothetical protein